MENKDGWKEDDYGPLPTRDANFTTISGEELEPLYTPDDIEDLDYERDLSYPGRFPFTRGVQPKMYRGSAASRTPMRATSSCSRRDRPAFP
jgi:methylmalonyl-CoA mutase N-terminal domain/subunit